MVPPSYMQSVVDRNVVMRRMTVLSFLLHVTVLNERTMGVSWTMEFFCVTNRRTNLNWGCYRSFCAKVYWWYFWSFTAANHMTSCRLVDGYHHYESHVASISLGWGEDRSIILYESACNYRGADKSLTRAGRKQARKNVRDARDLNIETRAVIKCFLPLQGKGPKEIHAILTETLVCFLAGRAKDLSAPLYLWTHSATVQIIIIVIYLSWRWFTC